eukprot:s1628_g9.t1
MLRLLRAEGCQLLPKPWRAGTRQSKGFDEPPPQDAVCSAGPATEGNQLQLRSSAPTAESSKHAEFVLPDRRAVAAALQRAEAVPALLTGPREVRRAPLAPPRLQVEEDWPEEARAEFLLAFQQQMDAIREEDEKKAKQERQELWESIVHHLVGQWQGDGQDFTVQQAGDTLKVRRERGGSRQSAEATLWLDNRGRVVWGKHQSVLDMRTMGSKEIQWCRRTVLAAAHQNAIGPVVACQEWPGPQKRLAEVERKLGELILYEAQRYHNKHLCFLPKAVQNRALWDEAAVRTDAVLGEFPVGPEQFVNFNLVSRNSDLMQLVAEIAAYEDFVDEGNYNVVSASETILGRSFNLVQKYAQFMGVLSAEQFWRRSQLGVKEANLLLLATPALQARVLHTWRPQEGLSQEARGRVLRSFMGQVGPRLQVSSGMNSPQVTRRRKEQLVGLLSTAHGATCCEVTVGTTSFDDLVKEVDSESFQEQAKALGYNRLVVQRGRGTYRLSQRDPAILEVERGPQSNASRR